ncbi:GGDEF domain-containing protein [Nocardioides sp. YIM 152588]|uniref:GGDEF domain-containing protein n=1 Tax=Nocardioides sp. YIM 152588 TaxID=3158259 RepID=UPI0032E3DA35
MLDTETLRVVFVVVAACATVLFSVAAYGASRARYGVWWCAAMLFAAAGSGLYLFNGTDLQVVANPSGNAVGVLSTMCIWGSARSLAGRSLPWKLLLGVPAFVLAVALLDDPAHDLWTGGVVYLVAMGLGFVGASADLALLHRHVRTSVSRRDADGYDDFQYRASVLAMAVGMAAAGGFYLVRAAAFAISGPDGRFFTTWFGSQPTTLLLIVLLVVAVFSMSTLTRAQYVSRLRQEASHDSLTGLYNRRQFLRTMDIIRRHGRRDMNWVLVLADLDRLKQLNDEHGHAAGDRALAAIGSICRRHLLPGEFAARLGGDEFALLLSDAHRARRLAEAMNRELAQLTGGPDGVGVSFGVTHFDPDEDNEGALERADRALYEAKAAGGRQIVADGTRR